MHRKNLWLAALVVLGGFIGSLVSGALFKAEPTFAQTASFAEREAIEQQRKIEQNLQRLHELRLADKGALKLEVHPVEPRRCVGFNVVIAPDTREIRVFRAFEDGRVERFKRREGWGSIDRPGFEP